MGRYFWQPMLAWFASLALCFIITSFALKLGWDNKDHILMWGYATIGSASIFAWGVLRSKNSDDKKELDEKLSKKADVKDIENLKCLYESMSGTLHQMEQNQAEQHATVDNIYKILLEQKNRGE